MTDYYILYQIRSNFLRISAVLDPFPKLVFLCWLAILTACSTIEEGGPNQTLTISLKASGLNDGKLGVNARADFSAEIAGYSGNPSDLRFRWALVNNRVILMDGSVLLENPAFLGSSIGVLGRITGEETILVGVLDESNTILGTASMNFTILPGSDPGISRGCFDQPKLIFQLGSSYSTINEDGTGRQSLGISGGLSAAISPDGEWVAWNDDSVEGWDMYLQRCDGSERKKIPGGDSSDFLPRFSHDSKTLYFLRANPAQVKPKNSAGNLDIVAYRIESGELSYLTNLYTLEEGVGDLVVSTITGEIAFFRKKVETLPGGGFRTITRLSFLQPLSGGIRDFVTLPQGRYDFGLDWSPDGKDIIFSSTGQPQRGIFRINVSDGSQPLLVFADPSPSSNPPMNPTYYAGGTRIAWGGQENGQNNINIWSIDANGNDMRQLTNLPGNELLQGVLR